MNKFSYQNHSFDLTAEGLQQAYLCFLMNEDPAEFREWQKNNFFDYPDAVAWGLWKQYLKSDHKMIYAGETK